MPPLLLAAAAAAATAAAAPADLPPFAPPPPAVMPTGAIGQVTLAPLFARAMACVEHPAGQLPMAGDALGTDCMATSAPGEDGVGYARLYRSDGKANADWYGWGVKVHAPVAGTVIGALSNPAVNQPGETGRPPAGMLLIHSDDGVTVVLAHIGEVTARRGDRVAAGEVVGTVSNNGFARAPHIHVGAFRGAEPLQIRWDLAAPPRRDD